MGRWGHSGRGHVWYRVGTIVAATGSAVTAALLGVALCGAATIKVTGTAGQAAAEAYPGANGRIAFVRNGNIFSIIPTPAPHGLAELTHSGHASGPRWSPDGTRIAFLFRGNLWIMGANGGHKTQITHAAPLFTDSRPTWSPNGRYLAFVRTRRHHSSGRLTRYNTVTRHFVTFTDTINGHPVRVAALPAPVAWAVALNAANSPGSFIVFEGAGTQCTTPFRYCLDALGFTHQDQYLNGFPSSEYSHTTKTRLTGPDWYPVSPQFDVDVLTTVENCAVSPCKHDGLALTIGATPVLPGAYEGVYSPDGTFIAFVQNNEHGVPHIYTSPASALAHVPLARGTDPDWQPRLSAGTSRPPARPGGTRAAGGVTDRRRGECWQVDRPGLIAHVGWPRWGGMSRGVLTFCL
jgi:WD40-like Beta Propeller Repeat